MSEEKMVETNWVKWFIVTPSGFNTNLTIPYKTADEAIDSLVEIDKKLIDKGIKVQEYKKSFSSGSAFPKKEKDWTGKNCPKDGGRLYKTITKTGKTMVKCENSKWDFMTKTASGCDHVEWPDSASGSTSSSSTSDDDAFGVTDKQKDWLKKLMEEGKIDESTEIEVLSKNEARALISKAIGK